MKIVVDPVNAADSAMIDALVALGDAAVDTLGLLPPAAYTDAARMGCLLVARHADEPIGYVLFRRPRSRAEVVLTHLCVRADYRQQGVARKLIEEVSERNSGRLGLRAKCRDDYSGIHHVWRGLGFDAIGSATGRGADRAPMTVWWRDHGHPNLFTPPNEEASILPVAIDTNIVMDLRIRPDRHGAGARSRVLVSPDLAERIELVVPQGGLEKDLERHPEPLRQRLIDAASHYPRPTSDPVRVEALFGTMLAAIGDRLPHRRPNEQDRGDLWQLAATAVARVKVFATWDNRLRTEIAPIVLAIPREELSTMRVIDPDHVVLQLDELADAAVYQPRSLEGSQFSTELAKADAEVDLQRFLNTATGETRNQLRDRLQRIVANDPRSQTIIRATDDSPVACYGFIRDDDVLRVEVLRIADHAIAHTMTRRVLWLLRETARDMGAKVVEINDPHLSDAVGRVAAHESYQRIDRRWYAWVVDECGSGLQVSAAVSRAHALVGLPPAQLLKPGLPAEAAAQYERTWWPAKITDSSLSYFAVPIQPRWSAQLFGYPETLPMRATQLALGREQVYYRSGRNSALRAPARILWYLSQSSHTGQAKFIGTSLLDAIDVDTPERLHTMLGHYGVFRLEDICAASPNRPVAQALRLSDVELFTYPVTRRTYEAIRTVHGGPKSIQAPCAVPARTFAELYARGTGRIGQERRSSP